MDSDYTIRRVEVADIPDFIALRGRMFQEVGFDNIDDLNRASTSYFARAIPSGEFVGFVAVTAAETCVASAGLCCYQMPPKPIEPDGRFGYISSMYVMSGHRRRGLARRMLHELVSAAHAMDLTWLTLHASEMGHPIYESAGFKAWKEMGLHVPTAIAGRTTG